MSFLADHPDLKLFAEATLAGAALKTSQDARQRGSRTEGPIPNPQSHTRGEGLVHTAGRFAWQWLYFHVVIIPFMICWYLLTWVPAALMSHRPHGSYPGPDGMTTYWGSQTVLVPGGYRVSTIAIVWMVVIGSIGIYLWLKLMRRMVWPRAKRVATSQDQTLAQDLDPFRYAQPHPAARPAAALPQFSRTPLPSPRTLRR